MKKEILEILKKHGYSICVKCKEPILDKNNKVNIIKEVIKNGIKKRETLRSLHYNCSNKYNAHISCSFRQFHLALL